MRRSLDVYTHLWVCGTRDALDPLGPALLVRPVRVVMWLEDEVRVRLLCVAVTSWHTLSTHTAGVRECHRHKLSVSQTVNLNNIAVRNCWCHTLSVSDTVVVRNCQCQKLSVSETATCQGYKLSESWSIRFLKYQCHKLLLSLGVSVTNVSVTNRWCWTLSVSETVNIINCWRHKLSVRK